MKIWYTAHSQVIEYIASTYFPEVEREKKCFMVKICKTRFPDVCCTLKTHSGEGVNSGEGVKVAA